MRGLFAGANPINLIVSDDCVLFQKATMFKKTMNFIDTRTGQQLEFQIPHGSTPPVAWAAFEGELYIPYLLKFTGRYPSGVRVNSDGRQETEYTTVKWDELDICVYDGRTINPLGEFRTPIPNKIYYEPTTQWDVKVSIESADIVAMAPVTIDTTGGALTIYDYQPGQPRHFIVAAAFGKDVYYWVRLDRTVEIANHRQFDSKVQSIIFASIQDIVITQSSLSASLLGQTGGDFGYTWKIPKEVGSVVGTPAFYGDVIFVLTQSGEVVAIGK
jgi:hypothetical protein